MRIRASEKIDFSNSSRLIGSLADWIGNKLRPGDKCHYQLDADSCRLVATEQSMSALIMRDVNAAPLKIMPSKLKIF
ncbi:MAG: hypothetical protein ACI8Z9_002062, partial [Paraglaciecola sp.]